MNEYSNAEEQITKQVNQYVEKIGVKKPKEKGIFDKILDGVQVGLDVVGLIPVVGEIADGVNGSIYLARGDKLNAALSFAAMVPVVGSAATGAKYVNKGLKYGEEIVDAGKSPKVARDSSRASEVKQIVGNGQQFTNGRKNKLKPNVRYKTGEYEYFYETDHLGRISKFETDNLQLTKRENRLPHSKNTPGKIKGQDHAGHLAADRFGGSPKLDNLVSQLSDVNLKEYKKIEDKWATALKEIPPKKVTVDAEILYSGDNMRPEKFKVRYTIDGEFGSKVFRNKLKE